MKQFSIFLTAICVIWFASCNSSGSGELFNGSASSKKWNTSGDVSIKNNTLILKGKEAKAILKSGKYKNFNIYLELRTTQGGKGYVAFHTDPAEGKGYRIAINNDRNDPEWWKMTGSLLSVRNLTKSSVKENDWFNMNIRVDGQFISVYINGEPVVEYVEPAAPYRTEPNQNALLSEGTFALASTGNGEIQVKNITVEVPGKKNTDIQAQLTEAINEQEDPIIRLHQENFPILDYHVHLKGGLTKEVAARQSRRIGINYAVAPNCGIGFPITNDDDVFAFLDTMRMQPFILGMQAEGREWLTTFSRKARDEFDYVFTDALTFTDHKGRRTRLWIPEETWIEDEQQYMDLIVNKICLVLQEPVHIYVNSCFLPEQLSNRYDEFWTEERMDKFIDALAESGKALEINDRYQIPNKAIIMKAKKAGVKFTFGTNNVIPEVGMLEYCIRMKEECGLTAKDMYKPKVKL